MEKSGFFTVSKFLKTFQQCLRKSREYLNTVKRYFGKVFIKFERVEDSFDNSFGVRSGKMAPMEGSRLAVGT